MKKYFFILFFSTILVIIFIQIKLLYFSPPYLKVSDVDEVFSISPAHPTKSRDILFLFRVENVKLYPIHVLNISVYPPPPKCFVFKFLNESFTLDPGGSVDVWCELKYLDYGWWRISKVIIKYQFLGSVHVDEFKVRIFFICRPPSGEFFERRDGVPGADEIDRSRGGSAEDRRHREETRGRRQDNYCGKGWSDIRDCGMRNGLG